jgi:ankyrin repeat protein
MRKAIWFVFSCLVLAALVGCGNPKEAALKELQSLNLNFTADDFVRSVANGDQKAFTLFLDAGIDPNGLSGDGMTALMAASERGRLDMVKRLLQKGVQVNTQGRNGLTALMLAANTSQSEIVEQLLEKNADPSLKDHSGWSALLKAVYQGHPPTVQALLERSKEDINRALMIASLLGHKEVVKALIEEGAEVDAQAEDGRTALIFAASKGHKEVVSLLLSAGADPQIADRSGATAGSIAQAKGFVEVAALVNQAPPPQKPAAVASANAPAATPAVPPAVSPSATADDAALLAGPDPTAPVAVGSPTVSQRGSTENWWTRYGLDQNKPGVRDEDPDGDGFSNARELAANTSPIDPASHPALNDRVAVVEIQEAYLPVELESVKGNKASLQTSAGEGYTVTVGDQLKNLNYKVTDVEARNVSDKDGNPVDASRIKLRNTKTGETISLVKGTRARERGSFAVLSFPGSTETVRVELNQRFTMPNDPNKTYEVLDIRPTQVVVKRLDDNRVWTLQK